MRRSPAVAVSVLLTGAYALACGVASARAAAPAPELPPNVLLLTVDTLRPDALGWVAGQNSTPALDGLAETGVRLPAAVSPVPITLPAHTSLMTGRVPRRHGVRDNGQMVPAGATTLAQRLKAEGYATAAFVSGYPLASDFGLDLGFDRYDDTFRSAGGELERRAAATTAAVREWLGAATEPWFLWVHYYDPHDPYDPPEGFERPGPLGAYFGEVAAVDSAVAELLEALDLPDRKDPAAVPGKPDSGARSRLTVFTADHGESLGEHGESTHGFFVYDSTLLVPLVISWPGRLAPRELGAPARLVDVAPTVLDLLGLDPLDGADGISLRRLLEGEDQAVPPALLESLRPWISYGWAPLTALRHDGWKLIAAPRPELYALRSDPGETLDRVDTDRPKARELQALLRAAESLPATVGRTADDPETAARLKALGYIGAGTERRGEPPPGLPDPKDRIELWNLLGQAEAAFARRDFQGALDDYAAVLEKEPENPFALARAGMARLETGDAAGAADHLQRAVDRQPDQPEAREALAVALTRLQRFGEAERHWAELIRLQPRRAGAWAGLGNTLGVAKKPAEAVKALERAVELAPEDPELMVRLGFAAFAAGRLEQAVENLEQAAELVGPESFPHRASLGILQLRRGNPARAYLWLARSRPSEPDFAVGRVELARLELAAGNRDAARRAVEDALRAAPRLRDPISKDSMLGPLLR